ncbi:MAG: M48 family metalloprotease [Desulfovibrionales bacterium]|nr:M48 family metalloprotease [Desulfovibrionales bacterium]
MLGRAARLWETGLLCLAILFLPFPARAWLGEFTIRDELELARKFDLVIETRFPVVHDSVITGYVQSLVDRLVAVMPPQPFPIKVTVVRNGALNAFASAAGHVTIFTGLIANLDGEDELASVIAHELAHVSERHIARSIEKSQFIGAGSLLGILAGVLIGSQVSSESGDALAIGAVAGSQSLQLKYTRENEKDADQFGLEYLVKAGFSPAGTTRAFEKIRKLQWLGGGGSVPSYLTTHPGLDDRLGYMQERISRLSQGVHQQPTDNREFYKVRTLVHAWFSDANTANAVFSSSASTACLSKLGDAIALSRLHQVEEARARFHEALACNPGDPLWKREYGRFAFEYGELSTAVEALQEAVLKNPADLFALFFYARAVAEQGNFGASIAAMEKVAKSVPRDAEVQENLGRYHAAMGNQFDGHLHFARAFAYKRQFTKYTFHLQKAEALAVRTDQQAKLRALRDEIAEYREILGI